MVKSNNNSLESIDEQIKKLQEKKATLIEKQEKDVGKYLIKKWSLSSLTAEEIYKIIDNIKPSFIANNDSKNE
jgi:hypothetical protein